VWNWTIMTTSPARVALVRCNSYDQNSVDEAVARGLSLLGSPQAFFQPGENLLLKPNLLAADPPEKNTATHPAVFSAVARQFQTAGAQLNYGDSPAAHRPLTAARKAGIAAAAEALHIPLADLTHGKIVSFPQGNLIKQFTIAEGVLAADGIINISKMKTHALTRITGAVKNLFGCIPGTLKAEFHAKLQNEDLFSQMLVDLYRLLPPRLNVMDGIIAMQGNGPRNGSPRAANVLLFSTDAIALDTIAARIMNLDPALVPTLAWARNWGIGETEHIEIIGDALESFVIPDFEANRRRGSTTNGKSGRMYQLVKDWIIPRPVIDSVKCTRCGTCVNICPVTPKAVDWHDGDQRKAPVYKYDRCIRCYCCQETCPAEAIQVQIPPLGRLIHK
jgi:uncharacterized protein (DUF362 family)/NAD-dependent dihydropyrimidine dehydrogenase PreA subunit